MTLDYLEVLNDIDVVVRLILATVLGGLVGLERISRHHSAGIRTFSLVSLGSAVAAALNLYLSMLPGLSADVSRIPAAVVSGIGFLGAGTILVTGRKQIRGLSTAASLWVTACMGMAIGAGYLLVGIACFVLVVFSNLVLINISNKVEKHSKFMSIYIEVNKNRGVNKLTQLFTDRGFELNSIAKSKEKPFQDTDAALMVELTLDKTRDHDEILSELRELDYVNYVEEV
ncbi:MAG: MgtC/SapB family protein [Butyrivibrio sp.]|nr:MgtC/SapB family protein [Butyrivibrio sp.]